MFIGLYFNETHLVTYFPNMTHHAIFTPKSFNVLIIMPDFREKRSEMQICT